MSTWHIVTSDGRTLVRSRVARACVHRLGPDAVCYRAALAFEQSIDTRPCGYVMPPALVSLPIPEGTAYPDRRCDSDIEFNERLST